MACCAEHLIGSCRELFTVVMWSDIMHGRRLRKKAPTAEISVTEEIWSDI